MESTTHSDVDQNTKKDLESKPPFIRKKGSHILPSREDRREMGKGILEVLLIDAKGLANTDFLGGINEEFRNRVRKRSGF